MPMICWPIMLGATIITGYSLVLSLWPSLQGLPSAQVRFVMAFVVLGLHLALAVSLGSYAFEPTVIEAAHIQPPPPIAPVVNVPPANGSVLSH